MKKVKKARAKAKIKRERLTEKTTLSKAIKMHPQLREFFIKKCLICSACEDLLGKDSLEKNAYRHGEDIDILMAEIKKELSKK